MNAEGMRARFRGAFLGCFVGDALGRPFEGISASDPRLGPALEARLSKPGLWGYSDDTEMMLSVAESLLRKKELDPKDLLQTLAENYEPARGYGKGMKLLFQALSAGKDYQEVALSAWSEGSHGNGAAVRVAPIAYRYFRDEGTLLSSARASAKLTHAHPLGQAGCALHALALSRALQMDISSWEPKGFLQDLWPKIPPEAKVLEEKLRRVENLLDQRAGPKEAAALLGNGVTVEESWPLALFAFCRWVPSFEEILRNTILCGGDTDSIAAMSGALAGAFLGVEAIPAQWRQNLENGRKGRDYVLSLADGVFALSL